MHSGFYAAHKVSPLCTLNLCLMVLLLGINSRDSAIKHVREDVKKISAEAGNVHFIIIRGGGVWGKGFQQPYFYEVVAFIG